MDDATFLRNFSRRGRVVLLADGTALPTPVSVLDDPARAGAAFRINLISPEGAESGDRRTFQPGTIEHRDLPLPLLWQWQLSDGHKNAVVVGRIDHVERTAKGLGNARGVFDTGPWGREAERMVRAGMVRGVSGDYSKFFAKKTDKIDPDDDLIQDDKISVQRSQLVAATIVAKPAFEGCYIEILEDDQFLPNGIIEGGPVVVTAAALRLVRPDMVARLERLEQLEAAQLSLIASATAERVNAYRLEREREAAVARVRGMRNLTAAWKPLPSSWLSAKAKAQPRDRLGRWIEIGSTVRWKQGQEKIGGVQRGGEKSGYGQGAPFKQGRVKSFNAKTGEYQIEPLDGSTPVSLKGENVEVVKAVIPETPEEAQKINADLDATTQKLISDTDAKLPDAPAGGDPEATVDIDAPVVTPEEAIEAGDQQKKDLTEAIQAAKSDDPAIKGIGLDRLSDLMGAEIESGDEPFETNRETRLREKQETGDVARAAENDRFSPEEWPDREALGRQLFNNLHTKGETWEKDGAKYLRAGDRLRRLSESRLVSKKRRAWVKDTYGKEAAPIDDRRDRDLAWSKAFADEKAKVDAPQAPEADAPGSEPLEAIDIGPLVTRLNDLWGTGDTDEPESPTAAVDLWAEAKAEPMAAPDPTPEPKNDAVSKIGGDIVKAQKKKNAEGDDPLAVADKALAEGKQWGDAPKETPADELEFDEKGSVQLKQGQTVSLTNLPKPKPKPTPKPSEKTVNLPGGTSKKKKKPAQDQAPKGNWTEMAKTMFQNLHPDSSWDEADQTEWIEAAKKAMETKNAQ